MYIFRAFVFLLFATVAQAQTVGASMQGAVTDPSGAPVAGAAVQVLHTDTGTATNLATGDTGHWRVPILSPGDYQVKVVARGFQTVIRKAIHLTVGQDAVLDVRLELGVVESVISVSADAPGVQLTSGAVSGLVDEKQMRDLPLNGRSFQQLALLQTGVNAVALRSMLKRSGS